MTRDAAEPALGSATPLRFLPLAIRVPSRPFRAIAVGWLTAFLPAALLGLLLNLLLPEARTPEFPYKGTLALVLLAGFAPIVETLIMGAALLILTRLVRPPIAVLISAAGWAVLHSLEVPIWGLVVWWPFLVFSTLFVTWQRRSLFAAFLLPAIVHALNNLLPALSVAYPEFFGT